jgi:hypothetical protein
MAIRATPWATSQTATTKGAGKLLSTSDRSSFDFENPAAVAPTTGTHRTGLSPEWWTETSWDRPSHEPPVRCVAFAKQCCCTAGHRAHQPPIRGAEPSVSRVGSTLSATSVEPIGACKFVCTQSNALRIKQLTKKLYVHRFTIHRYTYGLRSVCVLTHLVLVGEFLR